jgi:hypothetical protein
MDPMGKVVVQINEDKGFRIHPAKPFRETTEPKSEKTNISETSLFMKTLRRNPFFGFAISTQPFYT